MVTEMDKMQVALADTFWSSFAKLPKAQTKKVVEFVTKFRQAADSSGINYEKIKNAAQPNFRSVRIDQAYRGIVLKPDSGRTYVLLWVDHHDDAYAWAERTKCEIHPETGVLQLYETEVVDSTEVEQEPQPMVETEPAPVPVETSPLLDRAEADLLGVGVPESMLDKVRSLVGIDSLEAIQNQLPVEAFEALYLYADGVPWDEILDEYHVVPEEDVDTEDVDAALERESSKRRFRVVEGELELREMLAAPLEKWRVFLHPTQRRLVERNWNGPVRVLGGGGTGKTVVAMHRAVWLAKQISEDSDERILFLTFNTNLAKDIEHNLTKLAGPSELERIEVVNIDAWVSRFLKRHKYAHQIVSDYDLQDTWNLVLSSVRPAGLTLPDAFFTDEWERVILPNQIQSEKNYLKISRKGRGVALTRKQRAEIWPVFDEMRAQMQHQGWRTYQDATLDALALIEGDGSRPYRHVIVDEAQDMGSEALTLIRFLAEEGQDDLFLVGDGHQRIYRKKAVMGQCSIKIVGRSRKLKVNYRTTEQIRRFASAVLGEVAIDDLDGDEDPRPGYRSLTKGVVPIIHECADFTEEVSFIAQHIREFAENELALAGCCVVLRRNDLAESYSQELNGMGLPTVLLGKQADNQQVPGVRVATMHRVKGLEFRHVFLASVQEGVMPNPHAIASEDPVEARAGDLSERALLHVSASRAIENLVVTYHGTASRFLKGLD
jgi:superfamily I DNA/RNA helicase